MTLGTESRYAKAEEIYRFHIRGELVKKYRGKSVAVEADSGDYFIADTEMEAYEKASKKHPRSDFYFFKVGEKACSMAGDLEVA